MVAVDAFFAVGRQFLCAKSNAQYDCNKRDFLSSAIRMACLKGERRGLLQHLRVCDGKLTPRLYE